MTPNIKLLRECSFPIKTIDPQQSFDDLKPLAALVGSAKIVGMGEATHGSKEFTLIRHRLFRFLVEVRGFSGLILEAPQEKANTIDNYIKTSKGNPKELLHDLGYWVHDTQEMLDVIEWMRSYNSRNPTKQIAFFGCDIPVDDERRNGDYSVRDEAMADICIYRLKELGANARIALWSHNLHISSISDGITTQGQFLKEKLKTDYIALVSLFNEGSFNAVGWDEELEKATGFKSFDASKAPKYTYEHILATTGLPLAVFDLRKIKVKSQKNLFEADKIRDVGSVYDPRHPERLEHKSALTQECDGVIWVDQITTSTMLKN